MREILFRGKREDNGEWVEGTLLINKRYSTDIDHYLIFPTGAIYGYDDFGLMMWEVEPETVGQYTGLTDKNGKKIFEGDILPTDLERTCLIVEFRDGCFMFNCNDGGKDYYDIMLPILPEEQTVYKYGEVIGNIHDNAELLGTNHAERT